MKVKKKKKSYKASNLPPGTIAYKGNKQSITTDIEIVNYSKEDFTSLTTSSVEDAFNFKGNDQLILICSGLFRNKIPPPSSGRTTIIFIASRGFLLINRGYT